jgi:hypothetical protein
MIEGLPDVRDRQEASASARDRRSAADSPAETLRNPAGESGIRGLYGA